MDFCFLRPYVPSSPLNTKEYFPTNLAKGNTSYHPFLGLKMLLLFTQS